MERGGEEMLNNADSYPQVPGLYLGGLAENLLFG